MRLSCTGLQACAGTPSRAESGGRKTVPRRLWGLPGVRMADQGRRARANPGQQDPDAVENVATR